MDLETVDMMLMEGIPFETIEDRINSAGLAQEFQAALWLYAWTFQSRRVQRRLIAELLAHAMPV